MEVQGTEGRIKSSDQSRKRWRIERTKYYLTERCHYLGSDLLYKISSSVAKGRSISTQVQTRITRIQILQIVKILTMFSLKISYRHLNTSIFTRVFFCSRDRERGRHTRRHRERASIGFFWFFWIIWESHTQLLDSAVQRYNGYMNSSHKVCSIVIFASPKIYLKSV